MTTATDTPEVEVHTMEPSPDDLGPSLTAEFTQAVPLEELVNAKPAPKARAQEQAPMSGGGLDPKMFYNMVGQVDVTLSNLMNMQAEAEEDLRQVADGLLPLAQYYSNEKASVTTLWIVAGLSVLTYSSMKMAQRQPAPEEEVTEDGKDE